MKVLPVHIIFLLLMMACLLSCADKSGGPDLRETYQYTDTRPFGGFVAHQLLEEIYPDKMININKSSFADFRTATYVDSFSLYVSISQRFYCSKEDAESLIDFVTEGNTAFISAGTIDSLLLKKVYSRQADMEWMNRIQHLLYSEAALSVNDTFRYFYLPFLNHFSEVDSLSGKVIGLSQAGRPNLIVLFLGKGRLYLHCEPRAFSNYFLLEKDNYQYMAQVLQYTSARPGNVFWDDFYNRKNYRGDGSDSSPLGALLQHPELSVAFWIFILLLLFFILFNGKRKQRIIPIIKPVENTSVAFTQAIAGLYMADKNNKTIADKMITYFNEYIRNRYFLNVHSSGKDFVQSLSKKSAVSFESVQALYNTMEQVQLSAEVSDFELLTLNEQIQQFYKNRN
ncbi:MAG: hypothetical protein EOO13_12650 [Chitinophagaceae bacterium]|nr:MAG: hypothetical protein EOO13_12650 [Chitinophagaceae bacterium]